jgi:hypothetical protein
VVRRIALLCAALGGLAACGDFETPSIVLDLRMLGARGEPPEVVAPVDPDNPRDIELVPVEMCALVADPGADRRLSYEMVACAPTDSGRCDDPLAPFVDVGFGSVDDPETAADDVELCGTVPAGGGVLAVLERSIEDDALSGFGGIEVQVEIAVWPEGEGIESAIFGRKTVLYAPKIPEERETNQNPSVDAITASIDGAEPVDLPLGRCGEVTPLEVTIGSEVDIEPVETEGAREEYVLPTFEGDSRTFTENLRYAFFATHGDWSPENTGGPRDLAGNEPPLDTTWTADIPEDDVGDGLDVRIWVVQRDERLGQAWYHSCIRVVP